MRTELKLAVWFFIVVGCLPSLVFAEGQSGSDVREIVNVPGAVCGDGSQSFVNVIDRSSPDLFIAVHGGGACWDAMSCGCDPKTSSCNGTLLARNLSRPDPESQIHPWSTNSDSPVGGFNVVEVPYCTGDLLTGTRRTTYSKDKTFTVLHTGQNSLKLSLQYARKRFPNVKRVLLMGTSAGGYGVTAAVPFIASVFGTAETFVIADSSAPFLPPHMSKESLQKIYDAWGSKAGFHPGITSGPDGIVDFVDIIRFNSLNYPKIRYGLDSASSDAVIGAFFPLLGSSPVRAVAGCLNAAEAQMDLTPQTKYYIIPGMLHGISEWPADMTASNGWLYMDWVRAMISGSQSWQSSKP